MNNISITLEPADLLKLTLPDPKYRTADGRSHLTDSVVMGQHITLFADADTLFAISDHFHRLAREVGGAVRPAFQRYLDASAEFHDLPTTDSPRSDGMTPGGERSHGSDVLPSGDDLAVGLI